MLQKQAYRRLFFFSCRSSPALLRGQRRRQTLGLET